MTNEKPPRSLTEIEAAIQECRRCPIGCLENRAVGGEGPSNARLMIVGEQPGDQEDRQGRPFVGPAGRVLDAHLSDAGLDRQAAYVTNAVKHFKFAKRGKRRMHQKPNADEIEACSWWLKGELALIRPRIVLALGTSAVRALLGRPATIKSLRGDPQPLEGGAELWATVHPSYLLRLKGDRKDEQERQFQADLRAVNRRLTSTSAA